MKTLAVLIECQVYDPATSSVKTLRFTNRNDPRATTYGGSNEWRPILIKAPSVGLSVFNGDFTGFGETTIDNFVLAATEKDLDVITTYVWYGAKIFIYAGDMAAAVPSYPLIYTAVADGLTRQSDINLTINLLTRDILLQGRQLLYLGYAGTGDIEGTTELKGVVKPMVFGDAKFCKPVLIDPVRQIYQVHGYGPVEAIYAVFEGGLAVGTGGNPAASLSGTYAAFRDTAVAQGQWIRHNNLGLIKLGSQPTFPITVHVKGDTNGVAGGTMLTKAADLVKRMITMNVSGVALSNASITTLNSNCPQPLDCYFDDQIMIVDAVAAVLRSVGAYWFWDSTGVVRFGRLRFVASTLTLSGKNDQGAADVLSINQLPTAAPAWSLKLGAEACHYVHDASSIAQSIIDLNAAIATVDANNNKTFPPGSTPPSGAVDGDQWPDTSTTPTTLRRYNGSTWVAVSTIGGTLGSSIYDARPATPIVVSAGQVITLEGTAAGITGQGSLATLSSVKFGSGTPLVYRENGSTPVTDALAITSLGTAAAIISQAAWATYTGLVPANVAGQVQNLSTGGALNSLSSITSRQITLLFRADGSTAITETLVITPLGTAAAIASQGALATQSVADWLTQIVGTGRPSDYANVSAVGDANRVRLSRWELEGSGWFLGSFDGCPINGIAYYHPPTVLFDQAAMNFTFNAASQTALMVNYSTMYSGGSRGYNIPVTPGERIFISAEIWPQGMPAAGRAFIWVTFWTEAGVNTGASVAGNILTSNPGGWSRQGGFFTVPAGTSFMNLEHHIDNLGGGTATAVGVVGNIRKPFVCGAAANQTAWPDFNPGPSSEAGAQVTRWVQPPTQSLDFKYDYTGSTAEAGEFSRDITMKLYDANGQITSGVTWDLAVVSGGFNAVTAASGRFGVGTSNGTGTQAISSLQTDEAVVELRAQYQSQFYKTNITLRKKRAAEPIGGTTTTLTKTSGWTSFSSTSFGSVGSKAGTLTGTSATISVNLNAMPASGTNGNWTVECRVMRNISGVWTQIGSTQSASSSWNAADFSGEYAPFSFSVSDSGIPAGSNDWRVEMRITSGSRSHSVTGTMSIVG